MEQPRIEQSTTGKPSATPQHAAPNPPRRVRWGLRFALGFGIATVVLAFATFELAKQDLDRGKQIKQLQIQASQDGAALQAMGQVTGAPDSVQVTLLQQQGGPPGQAHVLYNARLGLALYSGQVALPPADKCYQLWLVPASGSPANGGVVNANQESGAVLARFIPGVAAKQFMVTMEPREGSQEPTGPKVLLGVAGS